MTKASHCSSSSTLELVVHRLACAGCGWGCPALGPVWKQIFQVSAGQKWMRTITRLSIVNMNEAIFAWTAWEFSRFKRKEKNKNKIWVTFSSEKCLLGDFFDRSSSDCFFYLFFFSSSILVKLRFLAQNKTLMTAASDERDLLPFYGKRKFDFIFLFLPRPVAFSCFPSSLLSEPTGFATVHCCCCCFTMTNHNVARPIGPCVTFSGWPSRPRKHGRTWLSLQTHTHWRRHTNPDATGFVRKRDDFFFFFQHEFHWTSRSGHQIPI